MALPLIRLKHMNVCASCTHGKMSLSGQNVFTTWSARLRKLCSLTDYAGVCLSDGVIDLLK